MRVGSSYIKATEDAAKKGVRLRARTRKLNALSCHFGGGEEYGKLPPEFLFGRGTQRGQSGSALANARDLPIQPAATPVLKAPTITTDKITC